jgi:hypothetical protein
VKVPPLEPAERPRQVVEGLVAVPAEGNRLLVWWLLAYPVAANVMRLPGGVDAAPEARLLPDP